jgi:hypothetical protein
MPKPHRLTKSGRASTALGSAGWFRSQGVFFGGEPPNYWSESREPKHDHCYQQILFRHERPKQRTPQVDPNEPGTAEDARDLITD